jgi:hypothetical protein
MSYFLIGNISALISDDCIEPLANARIRVYLPDAGYLAAHVNVASMNTLQELTEKEVMLKADRLLAEARLDEDGNFSLEWEQLHLFTEALELDLCLEQVPGKTVGRRLRRQFNMKSLVPNWKRSNGGYLAAYAYVVPAVQWSAIRDQAGAWVIAGTVKHHHSREGQARLKVEAYSAFNGQLLGSAVTNELGRYKLYFSRKDLSTGALVPVMQGRINAGPDIYFKIYQNNKLVLAEDEKATTSSERHCITPCTRIHLTYKPSVVKRASRHIAGWLHGFMASTGTKFKASRYVVKDHPHV